MKLPSVVTATSVVLLLSGALLTGCASTKPVGRCDTAQAVGSCAVTVKRQGSRMVVCPDATSVATPACMKTSVEVLRGGRKVQQSLLLEPGQCLPLSHDTTAAVPGSCEAFATRAKAPAALAATAKE